MELLWSKKIHCAFVLFVVIVVFGYYVKDVHFSHALDYMKLARDIIDHDYNRRENNKIMLAQMEWDYYKLQIQFMKKICESKGVNGREDYLWLSALVNDEYALPAMVLGHSIRTLSCVKKMTMFATDQVSLPTREALSKVGWTVQIVEPMDCRWMQGKLGLDYSGGGIKGTHTRFHAWKYTQYSKIIYVDPDYMLLSNIDELFELQADFAAVYCNKPGILDLCFNAGLLVFRPNVEDYHAIMNMWKSMTTSTYCPHDQRLLTYYYIFNGRWHPLPYAYNTRGFIFYPMKAFHFVCRPSQKPWKDRCRPSRDEAKRFDQGITNLREVSLVYWKKFYEAVEIYDLYQWWKSSMFFDEKMEFGQHHRYEDCWKEP